MRGMRRANREIKSGQVMREILEECQVVRIGTLDDEGMFIVPVNFGYDFSDTESKWNLKLYLHGAGEGRKAEAFTASPNVAFEMDCRHQVIINQEACGCSFAYRSIMGSGRIRKLTSREEKTYALEKIMEHMAPGVEAKFHDGTLEHTAVYCIEAECLTGKERPER